MAFSFNDKARRFGVVVKMQWLFFGGGHPIDNFARIVGR